MWVTGIIQTLLIYGGFNLGWSFHIKLLGATLILVASLNINILFKKPIQKTNTTKSKYNEILRIGS